MFYLTCETFEVRREETTDDLLILWFPVSSTWQETYITAGGPYFEENESL